MPKIVKRSLRIGSKQFFVAERFDDEPDAIVAAAQAAGITLKREQVIKIKSYLRKVRGITKPVEPSDVAAATKNKPKKTKPKTRATTKAKAKVKSAKVSMSPKEAQLRKLIFELGFDAARQVFQEFERLHQTMRG